MPGEYDRYNMKRTVSLTANIAGEDLGRVAGHVDRAIAAAGEPPRGVTVDVRGQIAPMNEILRGPGDRPGHGRGRHPAAADGQLPVGAAGRWWSISTTPAVLAGVVLALWLTRDDAQHPVVHGGDHGDRRRGGQRDPAGHLRRAAPSRGAGRRRPRRPSKGPSAGSGRS